MYEHVKTVVCMYARQVPYMISLVVTIYDDDFSIIIDDDKSGTAESYIPLTINGKLSHMHGVLKLIFIKKKKETLSEDQSLPSLLRKFEVYKI